jgi:hypothetical protein
MDTKWVGDDLNFISERRSAEIDEGFSRNRRGNPEAGRGNKRRAEK